MCRTHPRRGVKLGDRSKKQVGGSLCWEPRQIESGRRLRLARQAEMILPTGDDPGHWTGIWGGISGGGGFRIVSGVSRDGAGFAPETRPSERFLTVARSEIAPDRYPVDRPLRYMRYPSVTANPRTPPMPFTMSGGHGCQNCRRGSM